MNTPGQNPRVNLRQRPAGDGDLALLRQIYCLDRMPEMQALPWTQPQKDAFLHTQFDWQHRHYHQHYPGAQFHILVLSDETSETDVGRVYWHQGAQGLHVIDITLLPSFRGRGLGTQVIGELQAYAQTREQPLSLTVAADNPAQALYQRLGFKPLRTTSSGMDVRMAWRPQGQVLTAPLRDALTSTLAETDL